MAQINPAGAGLNVFSRQDHWRDRRIFSGWSITTVYLAAAHDLQLAARLKFWNKIASHLITHLASTYQFLQRSPLPARSALKPYCMRRLQQRQMRIACWAHQATARIPPRA